MAQITKFIPFIFASNAGPDQIAKFGSLAANAPEFSTDAEDAQSLANFLEGWFNAVIDGNSPCIEDMNAIFFIITTYLAYLNQQGIPEWDDTTEYYVGSVVQADRDLYVAVAANDNVEPYTDATKWALLSQPFEIAAHIVDPAGGATKLMNECDPTAGSFNFTLPQLSAVPVGQRQIVKNIATNANVITLKADGTEKIDNFTTTYGTTIAAGESITVYKSNSTTWRTL